MWNPWGPAHKFNPTEAYALVCVDFDKKRAEKDREDIEFHLVVDLDRTAETTNQSKESTAWHENANR